MAKELLFTQVKVEQSDVKTLKEEESYTGRADSVSSENARRRNVYAMTTDSGVKKFYGDRDFARAVGQAVEQRKLTWGKTVIRVSRPKGASGLLLEIAAST